MPLDLILMGPPGAGKGTQAARIASERGLDHIATGDMLRAAVRDGTPLGLEANAVHGAGRSRVGRPHHRACSASGSEPTTPGPASSWTGSRARAPRRRRSTGCSTGWAARSRRSSSSTSTSTSVVRRLSGRRVCRDAEHVYHVDFHPPKVEGVCDEDGSELYQREDDHEDVVRARYEKQWVAAARPVLEYYTGRGLVERIDASKPRDEVARAVDSLIDRLDGGS